MFRTTEISNPEFEGNQLRFITVKTPNLKGRGDICVFVPPDENLHQAPLVILLHGVYGSAWSWALQGGVHFTASEMIQQGAIKPMVIAMPSDGLWGDGSGYMPHNGFHFEKWIVEDVPQAVRENITALNRRSRLFIGGLSMGGFGALRLGVKYHGVFAGISAHSAITDIAQMALFVEEELENYGQASVWALIKKYGTSIPPLRFDCGTEDPLLEYNRMLHRQMSDADIEHTYREFPGGHEWPYWQKYIRESLLFFDRCR